MLSLLIAQRQKVCILLETIFLYWVRGHIHWGELGGHLFHCGRPSTERNVRNNAIMPSCNIYMLNVHVKWLYQVEKDFWTYSLIIHLIQFDPIITLEFRAGRWGPILKLVLRTQEMNSCIVLIFILLLINYINQLY